MWVFEENINGRKLTDIINTEHENVKYLPGYKLPDNVVRQSSFRPSFRFKINVFHTLSDSILVALSLSIFNTVISPQAASSPPQIIQIHV